MKPRSLPALLLSAGVLLVSVMLNQASPSAAQDQPARVQRITGRLQAGETHAYLLNDLRAGDQLTVSMRATSGNLDPAIGIMDTTMSLAEFVTRYRADLQRLLAGNENVALALDELRNRYFLAWDDDSGDGLCGRPGVRRSHARRLCVDRRQLAFSPRPRDLRRL